MKYANPRLDPVNARLVGLRGGRALLSTPALILDIDRLDANIETMASLCASFGVNIRPHAKCHKSVNIARLQVAAGAVGVCCATIGEAEVMAAHGITNILITSPMVTQDKIARACAMQLAGAQLCLVVDNPANAREISSACMSAEVCLDILVDVDPGMGRTGVTGQKAAINLARLIEELPSLSYRGLQCYAGHIQHIEPHEERETLALQNLGALKVLCEELRLVGLAPEVVSGAGTGSFEIDGVTGVFTEIQAGSYVFMDKQYNRVLGETGGDGPIFYNSLFVQATVISNNYQEFVTCDAGLKHFAVDGGVPILADPSKSDITYIYCGDDHGRIIMPSGPQFQLGERVEFIVPHCDPNVNLYNHIHCVRGDMLVDIWAVDARGV